MEFQSHHLTTIRVITDLCKNHQWMQKPVSMMKTGHLTTLQVSLHLLIRKVKE